LVPEFRSPLLLPIGAKLKGAFKEWGRLEDYLSGSPLTDADATQTWVALTATASAIHNVYNGIEDALKVICRNVDGHVPEGGSSHRDILDQLVTSRKDVRSAVLSEALHEDLSELKRFRHVVNHNYSFDLREDRVMEIHATMARTVPALIASLEALDDELSKEGGIIAKPDDPLDPDKSR